MRVARAWRTACQGDIVHPPDADHAERSAFAEIGAGARRKLPASLRRRRPVRPEEIADLIADLRIQQHLVHRVSIGEDATIRREQLGRGRYREPGRRSDRAACREDHSQSGQPSRTTQITHGSLLSQLAEIYGTRIPRPLTRWMTRITMPIRKRIQETWDAIAAMPKRPRAPAMSPTIRNASA